ncbi:hypothetical protein BC834DRAFT_1046975 [Gloeopeniophorella convolvens]|nr:hypothetical protein BC834DRAFT_1046975 [Gloeopeniophorella convolvens]
MSSKFLDTHPALKALNKSSMCVEEYNNITGTDLALDPLASKLQCSDSVDAVIGCLLLQKPSSEALVSFFNEESQRELRCLVGLFESISNFLERLKIYTDGPHSLAPRMSAILVKIQFRCVRLRARNAADSSGSAEEIREDFLRTRSGD